MDIRLHSLGATVGQVLKFARYVFKQFLLARFIAVLMIGVLIFEYLATSLMIPLSGNTLTSQSKIAEIWTLFLIQFGLVPSFKIWLWLFFIVLAIRILLGYVQLILIVWLGKLVHKDLSDKIFKHIIFDEPLIRIYQKSIGHYIVLAGDDTSRSGTIVASLTQFIIALTTSAVTFFVLFQFSFEVFSYLLLFLLMYSFILLFLLKKIIQKNALASMQSRELNTNFLEALNNIRSIRAMVAEVYMTSTYAKQIKNYVHQLLTIDVIRSGMRIAPAVLLLIVAAIALRPGVAYAPSETTLFAITVFLIRVFTSLGQIVTTGTQLLTDIRGVRDIKSLLDSPIAAALPAATSSNIQTIEIENLDFSFSNGKPILQGFNAQFHFGKSYAIIGASGSGKSTFADLLLGLVQPLRGTITLNQKSLLPSQTRGRVLLVEQQPRIFSGTLRENLLLGLTASDDDLWAVLRLVQLDENIRHLRDGLSTELAYLGENFSGGQRQRIGIARALLRRPDVLILDEATSALDVATRETLITSVQSIMRNGIVIYITHDPEVAMQCDQIIEIKPPSHSK